ncbi:MAG: 1-deoxy-D-xylulose-5-phosphate reductoisomerase [Candidatus Aureabacteria bacterium]|nr:1-deoxy-D-xylulose-5-phosphate reductoisomerase [Candidatus Auribacterota bacterium]
MKKIVVLGSTGSIGVSTLEVAAAFPDALRVVGLGARRNIAVLREQIERFHPLMVAVSDESKARELRDRVGGMVEVLGGEEGIARLARMEEADTVVSAIVGAVGLVPTLEAIRAGKGVALANKEVLVCGGEIIMRETAARGVEIMPVDSEHSALHQCLRAGARGEVKRLILTASGGPFLDWSLEEMARATPEDALKHPRWEMGKKVTIDSATMMNKALEMIEARWLFGIAPERIDVVVHPESVVHSLVEFEDGSVIAQMSAADMRIPVQYALLYPRRIAGHWGSLGVDDLRALHFEKPDPVRFPVLELARRAMEVGGTLPAVLNAANEIAVERFLAGEIPFTTIPALTGEVMQKHTSVDHPSLDEVLRADAWARRETRGPT